MGLETATFVSSLVATNPLATDLEAQGDDHLRLLKAVLQATFPNADKAFRFPSATAKSANYTVLSTDDNQLFFVDTSAGAVTLTLPSLVSGDKGWRIKVVKTTTDANPIFIAPPSGTINGATKVRRSVEFLPFEVVWTGSNFFAQRQFGVPVGSRIPYHGGSLPNGTLWPDGTTFTAANFVELNAVLGGNTKPDTRGRIGCGVDNMGVGAANRVTSGGSGINGGTPGATGGSETVTVTTSNMPSHTHTFTTSSGGAHSHTYLTGGAFGAGAGGTSVQTQPASNGATTSTDGAHTHSGTTDATGSGTALNNMPPTFMQNEVLVAE